jgi:pimeloyl-ACP methyl ester carboxylesterase
MSYYDGGAGDPLVLIHGLGANAAGWVEQFAELSASYRLIAMDLRGHGGSGYRPEEPITIRAFADDIAALVEGLGVEQAHFCGISLGGMIVLELFVCCPSLMESLILADTTAFFPPPQPLEDFLRLFDQMDLAGWARFMAPRLLRPQSWWERRTGPPPWFLPVFSPATLRTPCCRWCLRPPTCPTGKIPGPSTACSGLTWKR